MEDAASGVAATPLPVGLCICQNIALVKKKQKKKNSIALLVLQIHSSPGTVSSQVLKKEIFQTISAVTAAASSLFGRRIVLKWS